MPTDASLAWPPRREDLERLARTHSQREIARLYGRGRGTIRKWLAKYGIRTAESPTPPATSPATRSALVSQPEDAAGADQRRVLDLLRKRPLSLSELADALDRGPSTVKAWLDRLQAEGYLVTQMGPLWTLVKEPTAAEAETFLPAPSNGHIRIGIVADTHLGSKMQQLTYLRETYRRFEDAGAQEVYHVGDLLDGVDVYAGQHAHQFLHTYDEQVDYAVAHYPRTSLRTKLIAGNHDLAGVRRGAPDPLRLVANRRSDMEYLGPYSAWPQLGRLLMYLLHPDGAAAYAISYKLQKIVESFEGGRKPHVLVVGHWHQMAYIHTRNVHAFYPGSFQAQTEYERRKALQPQIGAVLLDIQVAEDGSWHEATPTFYRYFVPREKDY